MRIVQSACPPWTIVVISALVLFAPDGWAQGVVTLGNYSERLSKDVPVSGRMLVGAVIAPRSNIKPSGIPQPTVLWGKPDSPQSVLCLTFASRDGQFYGQGTLAAEQLRDMKDPFAVSADYRPQTREYLSKLARQDFAVVAREGPCESLSDTSPVYVLAHEHSTGASGRLSKGPVQVHLLFNSLGYALDVDAAADLNSEKRTSANCLGRTTLCATLRSMSCVR